MLDLIKGILFFLYFNVYVLIHVFTTNLTFMKCRLMFITSRPFMAFLSFVISF